MADYLTTDTELTSIADAIRTKGGTSAALTYPDEFISAIEAIQTAGTYQSKTVSPTESQQTVSPDTGYDALSSVTVNAVSSTYVGSGITRRSSSDLSGSGRTVTAPAGYYASDASLSVPVGTATTPATTITANPTISVSSGGLITATASATKSVTPTVSAGYVSSGTSGTITVSGSNTSQLTVQAAQTIYPKTTDQTIASGKYLTGTQTFKAVATSNLTAANIKDGTTVKVGDSADDDRVASVTGTFTDASTVSSGQTAATAAKILSGYSAWVDGAEVKGSIATKTSSNLSASGATVTAPAGYYASDASKSVATGTVTAPASISGSSATVSTGTNTLTLTKTVSVTPSVSTAGYVSSGTAGNSSVSLTASVTTKAAATITPGTTNQTIASGTYLTGTQTISGDANLVAGNIKSGVTIFGVTGTHSGGTGTVTESSDPNGGTIITVSDATVIEPLNATQNGTYTETGKAYSPVVVNVSGGGAVEEKQVNFYDYDGTLLHSYTKTEANALTALPSNPTHTGLTSQGWNWTLQQIKAQLTAAPDGVINVGQMYVTSNGKTEIDVTMPEGRLSPILTVAVNGTISVDWGDNTTPDTVTGTSLASRKAVGPHNYSAPGDYTISISVTSGSFGFYCGTSYQILRKNTTVAQNRVYTKCVKRIRLGNGITSIGDYAFYYCCSLESITIPSTVTSIGKYAFNSCYSLNSVIIPSGVTSITQYAFQYCYALESITIPSTVTSIGNYAFTSCYSLNSVTIPSGVTSIGDYAFQYCCALKNIVIPSGVTSIGNYAFTYCYTLESVTIPSTVTSIGNYAFSSCHSLNSVTIPSGVTSIGDYAFSTCIVLAIITIPNTVTSIGNNGFNACNGMAEYHFQSTSPPTLGGTGVFSNISSDCIIYVPSASLSSYQSAQNWSAQSSMMRGE